MPIPVESDVYDDYDKMEEEVDLSNMENIDFSNLSSSHASNKMSAEQNETYTKQKIEQSVEEELKALEEEFYNESREARGEENTYYNQLESVEGTEKNQDKSTDNTDTEEEENNNTEEEKPAYTGQSFYEVYVENRKVIKEYVPLYLCEGSAVVWINITINQDGKIIEKTINTSKTGNVNQCFIDAALKGANKTQFNRDYNADTKQKGELKYTFVPQ